MTTDKKGPSLAFLLTMGIWSLPAVIWAETAQPTAVPAPRRLTLREAMDLAVRNDPAVTAASLMRARNAVALLRTQLDRVSLRVDSFLTEQWQVGNVGGPAPPASCTALLQTGVGSLVVPVDATSAQGNEPSRADCDAIMGMYYKPPAIASGWQGEFNLAANLQVPLFTGFRVTGNVAHARYMRDASAATLRDTQRTAMLAVLRDYWSARRFELRQEVSEQAVARYNDSVEVVAARVRNGLAPRLDLNRMETRKQAEQSNLADMAGNAAEARAQLAVALGLGGTPIVLTEPAEVRPPPPARPEELESLLSSAQRERPDRRAAHLNTLAAEQFIRVQLANYYPQLSLSSLLQFSNNPYNPLTGARSANSTPNPFSNITGSAFLGGTLNLNVFDTLNTFTSVRDARIEHRRLAEEERRIGRAIESEMRTLHARLFHYYNMREPLLRARDIARDNLEVIKHRYKSGDIAILDYIEAQIELLNSELNLVNMTTTIEQTWGELYLAAGRLPS